MMALFRLPRTIFFLFTFAIGSLYAQQRVPQVPPAKTRILFVLDGSGSMETQWNNQGSRMAIARSILSRLVDSLRVNSNLELALRVYGHQYAEPPENCKDSKLEVPFRVDNHDEIIAKIRTIKPKGATPITYALEQAAADFSEGRRHRNIVILITDGIESCDGDPCSVSLALQKKGVFLRPYIVGLGLEAGNTLNCMGRYIDAKNASSFNRVLNQSIASSLAQTTVSIDLLDGNGKPTESNVNITFRNQLTGEDAYDFIHYRDAAGRPDSVEVDPSSNYDIIVHTVPPVIVNAVALAEGKHRSFSIPIPQGNLIGRATGRGNDFSFVVRKQGGIGIINQQQNNQSFRYLAGQYLIETLTLPRRIIPVTIEPNQTASFTLPGPGLVNINSIVSGVGILMEEMSDGTFNWVCNLSPNETVHSYRLLPGKYKVSFRAHNAGGSKYTGVKRFEVKSGETISFKIFP